MSSKKTSKKLRKDFYLKVPYHILNLRELTPREQLLLAHFHSFGAKGCWQSNKTLAGMFNVSSVTVRRCIKKLKVTKLIGVKSPKGYYRTIWSVRHPQVRASFFRTGGSDTAPKPGSEVRRNDHDVGQNGTSELVKSEHRDGQDCAATNNITIKENNKETTATPPPLPAGGQASALLEHRTAADRFRIMKLKSKLGKEKAKPMTSEEFDKKRQRDIAALYKAQETRNREKQKQPG
ncbi:MAG TPA: hypothetical protein HPP87_14020 [Planctomycetes bacterium]|nr:hypothetical protein [Planctomycetota bacterium]